MSDEFKVEIVNPDKSFYSNESVKKLLFQLLKVKWEF